MFLTDTQRATLKQQHKKERDRRIADRIKAVLLRDAGWSYIDIAEALLLDKETIRIHIVEFQQANKLKPANGGSQSKLNAEQTKELAVYLEKHTQVSIQAICQYVKTTYAISYSSQGMHNWLHQHGFCYKKAKGVPAKADAQKQAAFIKHYKKLRKTVQDDEPIIFMDASHPTMATKLGYGWIKKGQDKHIATTASRSRVNITGGINIQTMQLLSRSYQTINGASTIDFLKCLAAAYPSAPCIHVILDQSGYHKSQEVANYLATSRIQCHFLPPYSPNLNPIERLWKIMNVKVRNNRYFTTPKIFKEAIDTFLEETWPQVAWQMKSCINDNFQQLQSVSSH